MSLPLSFPPVDRAIERHAAIGDRRTAALVAADGTLDWWCVPDFDGPPIFDALLDGGRGGFCHLGPADATSGQQDYLPRTTAVTTRWASGASPQAVEVTDVMAWPEDERVGGLSGERVILRRLRVTGGAAQMAFTLFPRWNFAVQPKVVERLSENALTFRFEAGTLGLWTSFAATATATGAAAEWTVPAGEEHWMVLGWNSPPTDWSAHRAAQAFAAALTYWRDWSAGLDLRCTGERADAAQRTALTVQLLTHAQHGAAVASLTTSLPERLGGDRNYDYRYAWVRDASLALALLARLGKADQVRCYFHWLAQLDSSTDSPLQVVYSSDGGTALKEKAVAGVRGYADSLPVRTGNRAAKQRQLGSLASLADCVRIYLEHGGKQLDKNHWDLVRRAADYTVKSRRKKDSGIWELEQEAAYVSSRAMAWVVLERAGWIAAHTGYGKLSEMDRWREEAICIHEEVMDRGWCEEKQAFRQRYDTDTLDAAALLIPLMRFLPPDHPRCVSTLAAIERELVVDGLLHRFDPRATLGSGELPIGEFEAAFLPCVCWHAHLLALLGRVDEARRLLARCDAVAGGVGLLAEQIDPRQHRFLGNSPMLFSHAEYVRAAIAIHEASSRG